MATEIQGRGKNRKRWWVLCMFAVVLGMNGLAYASVPAYRAFCQAIGFAGIPKIASQSPDEDMVLERKMTIRFNSDISPDLDWRFKPVQRSITFQVGETGLAFFEAINRTDHALAGTATFNVTPLKAAPYFVKIACFCFDQQILAAHETAEMPVTFFVDPEIADDPNLDDVTTITLSYTFFADEMPDEPAAGPAETVTRLVTAEPPQTSVN